MDESELSKLSLNGGSDKQVSSEDPGPGFVEHINCSIFVGNIPYKVTWQELKSFFSQFGNVRFVNCVKHVVTKRNLGAAFVDFESPESVQRAKTALPNELTFHGRVLRVGKAKNKSRDPTRFSCGSEKESQYKDTEGYDAESPSPISCLNDDCLTGVISFIDPFERVRLKRVNTTWRRCVLLAAKRQKHLALRKPSDKPFYVLSELQMCHMIRLYGSHLTTLDLSLVGKQIGKATVEAIVRCCKKLSHLDISGALSLSNHGMDRLALNCPNLKWLRMNDCPRISEKGMWSVFHHCKQLEYLRCYVNRFTGKCFRKAPPSMSRLHLRHCQELSAEGISRLANACPNLQSLDLNNCQLDSPRPVREVLKSCPRLEDVDIGHFVSHVIDTWPPPPPDNPHVILSLARPELITRLMIDSTDVSDPDLIFVCTHCPHIKELDVSCNYLTDISVTQLSSLTHLEILHICHLYDITGSALMDVVHHGKLKTLRMQGCKNVGDELLEELARFCLDLQELDVAGCIHVTSRTLDAFCRAIEHGGRNNKLYLYAFNTAFLDSPLPVLCPSSLSLCVIYRHLYPSHSRWVTEGQGEPYNIVVNVNWDPQELHNCLHEAQEAAAALADGGRVEMGQWRAAEALPADLVDDCGEEWEEGYYDNSCDEFLVNDDPLEEEYYHQWS